MSQLRDAMLEWTSSGRLKPEDAAAALDLAGLTPRRSDWRNFLDMLLLWTGVILLVSGVLFFFAYNWSALPRMAKFGLAELLLAAAFISAWVLGIDRPAGKGALCGAAILTGALLALVGQIYQTGADTYELFLYWALLIVPWVLVGRFAPLWLLWLGLIDIAVPLFCEARNWSLFGFSSVISCTLWSLLAINLTAEVLWEIGQARGIEWLSRWGARIIGTVTGTVTTTMGVMVVVGFHEIHEASILAYLAWVVSIYLYHRRLVFDVFLLSGVVLSLISVTTAALMKYLLRYSDVFGFLLIGFLIIGMSAAGAWWIRSLVKEQPA